MGSQVKIYVNNGLITRTADPLNSKFCEVGKGNGVFVTNPLHTTSEMFVMLT